MNERFIMISIFLKKADDKLNAIVLFAFLKVVSLLNNLLPSQNLRVGYNVKNILTYNKRYCKKFSPNDSALVYGYSRYLN